MAPAGSRRPDPGARQAEPGKDPQSLQTLALVSDPDQLNKTVNAELIWLGRLAGTRLRQLSETGRLYEAISRLAMAERLQRALYAIADLAGTAHNMTEMMQSLHATVGMLMYAENFFIILYDPATDSVRFPYYVDTVDQKPPLPDESYPLQDMRHSLSWNLLQNGQPLMGSVEELSQQLEGPLRIGRSFVRTLAGCAADARQPGRRWHRRAELSLRYALHASRSRPAQLRGTAYADGTRAP